MRHISVGEQSLVHAARFLDLFAIKPVYEKSVILLRGIQLLDASTLAIEKHMEVYAVTFNVFWGLETTQTAYFNVV
jgi:hypothetical protein